MKRSRIAAYFRRLPNHPGFGIALICSVMGAVAGRGNRGAIVRVLVMSIFWVPVLIANRSRYDR
jgi:hypothetical protein